MKVLLDIPDNEAIFGMKVLKSLPFVKKAKPMTDIAVGILDNLKKGCQSSSLTQKRENKIKNCTSGIK